MKKLLYIFLIAGATTAFTACSPETNEADNQLEGQGTDAEGNIRTGNVGTTDGAPVNDQQSEMVGENIKIREGQERGPIGDNAVIQQDKSTGTGLNPGRVDADTTPNTGRQAIGDIPTETNTTGSQGSGERGTGTYTKPIKR